MISYTPPTKRRRWPGILVLAIVLVVFLFLISACGSQDAKQPTPPTVPTSIHEPPNIVRIDMGQDTGDIKVTCWNGYRIFIGASNQPGYSSEYKNGGLFAVRDSRCDDKAG